MIVTERDISQKKEEIKVLAQMLENAKRDLKYLEKQMAQEKPAV